MAFPLDDYVRIVFRNQATPATRSSRRRRPGPNKPNLNKYDVQLANALLDHFGYKDHGWRRFREMPTASRWSSPLVRPAPSTASPMNSGRKRSTRHQDQGRLQHAEVARPAQAGPRQLQFWGPGLELSGTDGNSFLQLLYSKNIGQSNFARLKP